MYLMVTVTVYNVYYVDLYNVIRICRLAAIQKS